LQWDYPNDPHALDEAYKYQFLLGRDVLIAPVYRSQAASRGWRHAFFRRYPAAVTAAPFA
jgi:hypothetical protein